MCADAGAATASPTPNHTTPPVDRRDPIPDRGYGRTPPTSTQRLDPARDLDEGTGAVPVQTEVLVIGSGIAGLTCALQCASAGRVALVTKDRLPESSSQYAQGGIASVWSPEDSFESHIEDTLTAGAGLCHRDVVDM